MIILNRYYFIHRVVVHLRWWSGTGTGSWTGLGRIAELLRAGEKEREVRQEEILWEEGLYQNEGKGKQ